MSQQARFPTSAPVNALDPSRLRREDSVFINAPFDSEFRERLDAIVFAVLCNGLMPRTALEWGSGKRSRMERIVASLRGSRLSIHDLSRCTGEGEQNLARFNMPFELGMATGEGERRRRRLDDHDWLLLVPRDHPYRHFISDLAGHDAEEYDGTPHDVVKAVLNWLAQPQRVPTDRGPDPDRVTTALPVYLDAARRLREQYGDRTPWERLLRVGLRVAKQAGLVPELPA